MKFICQCIFPLLLHLIVKLTFMKQLKKKKKKKETNPLCISHAQRVIFTCLKRELKNYYKRYRVYSYLIPTRDNQIKNYAFSPPSSLSSPPLPFKHSRTRFVAIESVPIDFLRNVLLCFST